MHPTNLVSCSAHSHVGDLPHLSVQGRSSSLEVCSLQVYPSLGFLWGHSIGFPLWGLGQICHSSPSWGSCQISQFHEWCKSDCSHQNKASPWSGYCGFNESIGLICHNNVKGHLNSQYFHPQLQVLHTCHNVSIDICV